MTESNTGRRLRASGMVLAMLGMIVGVPAVVFFVQARHSGLSLRQQWEQLARRGARTGSQSADTLPAAATLGDLIPFLGQPCPIGFPAKDHPMISFVRIVDLDQDGLADVLVCDALANQVSWIRQVQRGEFEEHVLANDIPAPAHVEAFDVDKDGDLDLLVASMGMIFPNNDRIGAVIVLEKDGMQHFVRHSIVDRVARVTDVRAGDLDQDGDVDLVAGQFGYDDGEIRWLEKVGRWQYQSHILLRLSGTIHTPIADMDGDGDLDIVALVSQEWEETYLFENLGHGQFATQLIYGSANEDFGSSGIDLVDLDHDGDLDVLYTNGDAFDYLPPRPRPWHGMQWLENQGQGKFAYHRLADFAGASVARAADVDHDGDLDIIVSSAYNFWERPDASSLVWLENHGKGTFVLRPLARAPTHLIAMDVGDLDGDGWVDVVTGGMHVYPPYDRIGRVTFWRNEWLRMRRSAQEVSAHPAIPAGDPGWVNQSAGRRAGEAQP